MPVKDVLMTVQTQVLRIMFRTVISNRRKYKLFRLVAFFPFSLEPYVFRISMYSNELMTIHSVALLFFRFKNCRRRPYCIPGNGAEIHQGDVASGMEMFIDVS